ncbi:hypothetical protein ACFZCP_38700 [Streptomyces sp. NPDC007971]|uniref:hypothetical protein n=1 Tax=Streptomyces sp. NPDC007971 TaxID=3364799 RepID=UPI0036E1048A
MPQDDFSKLTDPDHWLGWLGDDPAAAFRKGIEESLRAQVADAVVEWVKILETPRFFTGRRRHSQDQQVMLVTRAAPFDEYVAKFTMAYRTVPRHSCDFIARSPPATAQWSAEQALKRGSVGAFAAAR